MKKYKKLPLIVEAIQYKSLEDIPEDCSHFLIGDMLYIRTLEGNIQCNMGDYIIKGIKGEYYSCKENIFLSSYELVNGDS